MRTLTLTLFLSFLCAANAQGYQVAGTQLVEAINAEAQMVGQQSPQLVLAIESLSGIQPEHYLKRRRPEPEVTRELQRLDGAAVLLMSLYLTDFDSYPFIQGGNPQAERRALQLGTLATAGTSGHPLADSFLMYIFENKELDSQSANILFRSLGQTQTSFALDYLKQKANNSALPMKLRQAAVLGIGHHRTEGGASALLNLLNQSPPALQQTAISASAALGSSWAWQAQGQEQLGLQIRTSLGNRILTIIQNANANDIAQLEKRAQTTLAVIATDELKAALDQILANTSQANAASNFATQSLIRVQRRLSRR